MNETGSRPRMCVFVIAMLVFSITLGVGPAHAVLSLYDDFNDVSNLVNETRWVVTLAWSTGAVGAGVTESIRGIDRLFGVTNPIVPTPDPADGKLLIGRRFAVRPGASVGFDRVGYNVVDPGSKTGIQANVTLHLCVIAPDPGPPATVSRVQARLIAGLLGDGSPSTGPGDEQGDILAILRVQCLNNGQAEITGVVFQCLDAACISTNTLRNVFFGPANLGQEYNLHLQKVGNAIVFTVDGQTQQFAPGPTAPPKQPFFQIGTRMDDFTPQDGGNFAVVACFNDVFVDQ